ncbi:group I truncated hemoglobin [Marinobacter sp. 1Y8]
MRKLPILVMLFALLIGYHPAPAAEQASLYKALGERQGIATIVEDMLYRIVDDPRIAKQFKGVDIAQLHQHLTDQVCNISGGPCAYTGRDMREAHTGLDISETGFNALVEDLILSMEKSDIPVGAQNELLSLLVPMHDDIVGH